jgi:hypothetical protein
MWGLHEYWLATGEAAAQDAAHRTAELFLAHRLFRSLTSGEAIAADWLAPHYPPYWRYDVPQALLVLSRMGLVLDPRANDGIDLLLARRRNDGRWEPGRSWWRPPGSEGSNVELVDWGRRGPSRMVTLNALRILVGARRLTFVRARSLTGTAGVAG